MDVVQTFHMICWIACAVGAALLRGVTPALMRAGAKRADPSFAAAIFTTVLSAVTFAWLYIDGEWSALIAVGNRSLLFLALYGLLSAFTCLCLFTAMTGAGASRVCPLVNLSGVMFIVFSYLLFDGRLGIWRLCCIVLVLLGTVLMESRSQRSGSLRWLLYAGLALLSLTAETLLAQAHLTGVSTAVAQPLRCLAACVLLWIFTLVRGKQASARAMGVKGWLAVPFAAVCFGLALVCDGLGPRFGEWSWLAPIRCLGLASMLLFARIFLKEKLSGSAIFGMLLVLLGEFAILMGW